MKLLVLGATGGVGVETVRQAIEHGHSVTAFVRSAEKLKPFARTIVTIEGNPLDSGELVAAMSGQDIVLSAFGPRLPIAKSDAHLLRDFGMAVTRAMAQAGIRRGIIVSTAFLFRDAVFPPAHLVGRIFFPAVTKDAGEMEDVLRQSGLDLTLVRPPQLKDKPWTGKYRVREGHLPLFGFSISRANVADFMLRTAENGIYPGSVVGISE